MNKQLLIVILITGILFMILPEAGEKSKKKSHEDEQRLCEILEDIYGVGEVSVMVTYRNGDKNNKTDAALGAVITAEGADDIFIKNKLSEAAQAVLGLPAHKVKVFEKEDKR